MVLNSSCLRSLDEIDQMSTIVEGWRKSTSYFNFTNANSGDSDSTAAAQDHQTFVLNVIKIILYIIIICIALVGNTAIILVISFNRFMRKSTNYFILNLAVCDLAILVSCVWVHIVSTTNKHWILGKLFCKINSYMQMVSVIAAVLTLALISCDRYFGVMYPLEARITSKRSYIFITATWLIAALISVPSFIYRSYTERRWSDFTENYCDDNGWPKTLVKNEHGCTLKIAQPSKQIYFTAVILLLFFLPILIMLITYSIIIYKMWKSELVGERVSEDKRNLMRRRKRVIVMLIWILVVFVVCWSPLESMLLFMQYTEAVSV
jgi:hypothetical protein